jgi:hypothetical protein
MGGKRDGFVAGAEIEGATFVAIFKDGHLAIQCRAKRAV